MISICIPAYHADRYLWETLQSVARQSYGNWELIVTEDGSADDTEEIVRAFARENPQTVIYNRHPENRGLPSTRNTGIQSARGDWIAFLDSDDIWDSSHLETLLAESNRSTSCEMVFSGTICFENDVSHQCGQCIPTPENLQNLAVAIYTGSLSILPSSALIRREAFSRFGVVSTAYPHVNDTEYWLRILRSGGEIAYSGHNTCFYRKHEASMSRSLAPLLTDSARLCESHSDWDALPSSIRRNRPADLYRWAAHAMLPEHPTEAARQLGHSLRLQPINPKALGLWMKTVLQSRRAPVLEQEPV